MSSKESEKTKKKDCDMSIKEYNDEIPQSSLPDYAFASSGRFANDETLSTRYLSSVKKSARKEETKSVPKSKQLFSLTFDLYIRSPTAARTLVYNGMPFLLSGQNVLGKKPGKKSFLAGIQAIRSKPVGNKALRDKSSELKNKLRTARVRTLVNDALGYASVVWSRLIPEDVYKQLRWWQRANHFPGRHILGHKDKIATLFSKVRSLLPSEESGALDFMPESYVLRGSLQAHTKLCAVLKKSGDDTVWIRKPCCSSMGRGIVVFRACDASKELSDVDEKDSTTWCVIQKYVSNPYLVNGKKADMRVYVLVTSFDPLVVYLAQDGIVKFCTSKFDLSSDRLKNRYVHLANQAINKFSPDFVLNQEIDSGSRWTHVGYWSQMERTHGEDRVVAAKQHLEALVAKTFATAVPHVMSEMKRIDCESSNLSCFEIFGLDVEMDENLMPHLLEVNVAPEIMVRHGDSMSMQVVGGLASDMFQVVGVRSKPSDNKSLPALSDDLALSKECLDILKDCSEKEQYQLLELQNQLERSRTTMFKRVFPCRSNASVEIILKLASSSDGKTLPRRQGLLKRWLSAVESPSK